MVETGIFEKVVNVTASEHLFEVTVVRTKTMDEYVKDTLFSVLCD